jgi:hypothetical protein
MLADHFLDGAAITCPGLDQQDRLSLFDNPLFPKVRAGNRKPVRANCQLLFQEDATDLARLIGSVHRDVINSHDPSRQVPGLFHAIERFLEQLQIGRSAQLCTRGFNPLTFESVFCGSIVLKEDAK